MLEGIFMVYMEQRILSCVFLAFLLLSIICQITIGVIYLRLIKETDHISTAKSKFLKQCKLKFINCYQLSGEVSNISVFVDKSISKISFLGISMTGLHHLAGQFVLLSVVAAGAGACYEITQGETVGRILPYYVVSFLGLYVYFSITGLVDIAGKKERLKINLVDYLENHMANKLKQSDIDGEELTGETLSASKVKKDKKEGKKKEKKAVDEREKKKSLREGIGLSAERGEADPAKITAFAHPAEQEKGDGGNVEEGEEKAAVFSHQEAEELEELLREFLV